MPVQTDRDLRAGREALGHERHVAGVLAAVRPRRLDGAGQRRVRLDAPVAVLVDGVADHLGRAGAHRGDGVVAVLRARRAVGVAVEVDGVDARAVLVDPVVGHVGGARADAGVGVVAVGRVAHAVEVRVALDLLARVAGVAVVGDRGVVPEAAGRPARRGRRGR